ncbi:clostripain-related cysteine peptidase [Baia soyae]|uniref:Cysteine peptidase C11 family protein n=1 Tax=Baia soyae TaxID=1544746 RepID=A0A4R2RM60_9BACL|nr:clostripain-related cysteine peptidase [Baia soyae]TCP63739.1 cysteine peptidase C11 family protein [Baia soyae]
MESWSGLCQGLLWNHGLGSVKVYGSDEKHKHDALTLSELQQAFDKSQAKTNKFDMIGFDACLMANVEVAKLWSLDRRLRMS